MIYKDGLKIYSITEEPIRIHGLAVTDSEKRKFYRLPEYMMEKMIQYDFLGRRSVGGRVRFATDSRKIFVRMTLAQTKEDINIPLSGSAGADIYLGVGRKSRYIGYIAPSEHVMKEITVEKTFWKTGEMETVTINLPRNDHLLGMEIGVEEQAALQKAPDYRIASPVIFYGSSITEGGCASRAGNAYASIVCRWLDADYCNYGFSGSARGEKEFAEYIAGISHMSAFVYDYDHNAPDAAHLKATHEPFFQIIRKAKPDLPILILSEPDVDSDPADAEERIRVIQETYRHALEAGDKKVWFLDGRTFFGETGREECTVDGTHPNALGFMRMAEQIYPALQKILVPFISFAKKDAI